MKRAVCIAIALTLTILLAAACGKKEESVTFTATVKELGENSILVLADEGSDVRRSSDLFTVGLKDASLLDQTGDKMEIGELWPWDRVKITFNGHIEESYPAQIGAKTVKRIPKEQLTLERVKELAQKGDDLAWEDFYPYEGQETGSGLLIMAYELADYEQEEDLYLVVGGSPYEGPWYIHLCRGLFSDEYIDIRETSIDDFLEGKLPGQTGAARSEAPEEEPPFVDGTASTGSAGDYPAAIRIEGKVYIVGQPIPVEVDESAIIGYTTSYTDGWPQQDGETNFSRELNLPIARVENGFVVLYENEWHFCDLAK